jgi:sugar lactone lactonase YvrE
MTGRPILLWACAGLASILALTVPVVAAKDLRSLRNAGPVFGLTSGPGELLAADAGQGIVRLRNEKTELVVALPGVTDVEVVNPNLMFAITGGGTGPTAAKLWRIEHGQADLFADLGAFEATVNPDGAEVNPNPFDLEVLPDGRILVADAGANTLLIVDQNGTVDWVATLPTQLVSTANIKMLVHCPAGPANICNLPPQIPAQAVTPSIAIGPDGAYYLGELKGFPAPTGASRVWRIDPEAQHVHCDAIAPECRVVADGFTSIIDLAFDEAGTLYVTELDEASWFAIEVAHTPTTGTVNACELDPASGEYACSAMVTGLAQPTAVAVDHKKVYVTNNSLTSGAAQVLRIK